MSAIVDHWLNSKGWEFHSSHRQSRTAFELEIAKLNGTQRLELYVDTRLSLFAVHAYPTFKIPTAYHAIILEIIARANWGHEFARFELNLDSKEFRSTSSAVLAGSELSEAMIERMTMFVLDWLDSFTPTLQSMVVVENLL